MLSTDKYQLSTDQYRAMLQMTSVSPKRHPPSEAASSKHIAPVFSLERVLSLAPCELVQLAKDANGSKFLQENLSLCPELRVNLFTTVLESKLLVSLSKDNFANFVIQKMTTNGDDVYVRLLFDAIEANCIELSFSRYACRVIQKLVEHAPEEYTHRLLKAYVGHEVQIAKDQNANHIVQRILEKCMPDVYSPFMKTIVEKYGLTPIIEDKYGCRIIQLCLERLVACCSSTSLVKPDVRESAFGLLHVLIIPILENAFNFAENEYANYVVQYILRTNYLANQRKYIIKNSILHNILFLSQGKFASHVVEQALVYADDQSLYAMIAEILDGYQRDARGRDALDIMLFDQFANYVVQRLLTIAIEVYHGKRKGEKRWLEIISARVLRCANNLQRYSSGKKILDMLQPIHAGTARFC